MLPGDCYEHALELLPLIAQRTLLLLGDADCVSLAVLSAVTQTGHEAPKRIVILDFDKRVLRYIRESASHFEGHTQVETSLYNVLDPHSGFTFEEPDFFHVNPPFGSRNGGRSAAVWLYRAADMCGASCLGCAVLAANEDRDWCLTAKSHAASELKRLGFAPRDVLTKKHSYHSPWDPRLRSRGYLFSRESKVPSPMFAKGLPQEYRVDLYGDPVDVPQFIDGPVDS
jgi:predicted RNA methylase